MSLLPWTTLHSDSEHFLLVAKLRLRNQKKSFACPPLLAAHVNFQPHRVYRDEKGLNLMENA
jgi:hypothetical protein